MSKPKDYCTSSKLQKDQVSSVIEEFEENLMIINGKCMDVGCGPGDTTKDLLLPTLDSNAHIIGTDISQSMIEYANKTFSDETRLQFEVLNIQTKNLPKKYISEFDHIFSFSTLHWCSDIRQAFKNIYQMLRPNGTILLYIVGPHYIFDVLRILMHDIRFSQYIPDTMRNILAFQDSKNVRKELKELLQNVGFTVHHCSLRESSFSEKNSGQFLNSITSILTFLEDISQDLRKEFKNAFIHECLRRRIKYKLNNNQELTVYLYKGLVIHAQKVV